MLVSTSGTGVVTPNAVYIGLARSKPIASSKDDVSSPSTDKDHVEHSTAVPLMKRQAAGKDRRILGAAAQLKIIRRFRPRVAGGVGRAEHTAHQRRLFVAPGERAP